jgi:steroid delta-isomerase-like uncharacterized protein
VSEENKAVIRHLFDVLNAKDMAAFADALADNMVEHEELPGLQPNKQGVVQFFNGMHAAFDGLRANIDDISSEGDRVVVRATMSGTHKGEFMGIPATGKQLSVPFADFFRLSGGKVAEHWGVMDSGALMMQLGALG